MNSYTLGGFTTATALAFEASLLDRPVTESWCFWEGPDAVVIGKNQNLWGEVDAAATYRDGIPLHRRISGGGAVFHGPGNLNFCHIFPSNQPLDFDHLLQPLIGALDALGIPVERRNCSDLWIPDAAKVSGNAVARRRSWWLHHGTLLVNADLDRASSWLGNSLGSDLITRAVRSRPSPITNLADHHRELSVATLASELSIRLTGQLPSLPAWTGPPHPTDPAWIIGNTLPYRFRPPDPRTRLINVTGGRIVPDPADPEFPYSNCWHNPEDLLSAAHRVGEPEATIWETFFPSTRIRPRL